MHPTLNDVYQQLAAKYEMQGPFLELGAGNKEDAILSGSYFLGKPQRIATNLSDKEVVDEPDDERIHFVQCNSNNMRDAFADGQFGTVLSNAMIEHDKYFWRSLDEMKRVLAPGGILAIGAPGYIPSKNLKEGLLLDKLKKATVTYDVHSAPDYWRFSRMAFKEVICEGLDILETLTFGQVPILVAVARKPWGGLHAPIAQEERSRDRLLALKEGRSLGEQDDSEGFSQVITEQSQANKAKRQAKKEARLQERKAMAGTAKALETPEERRQRVQSKKEARLQKHKAKTRKEVSSDPPEDH
jgi:SAM-dependent methyltransferase